MKTWIFGDAVMSEFIDVACGSCGYLCQRPWLTLADEGAPVERIWEVLADR